jgi:hypothetical protein
VTLAPPKPVRVNLCEAVVMYQRFANMDEVNRVLATWYEF